MAHHPILSTVEPMVAGSRHVRIHRVRIDEVAGWMVYEVLGWPTPCITYLARQGGEECGACRR
jgi:hypothetical protein